jgi:hypothetical protein
MTDFLVRRDDLRVWQATDGEERAAEAAAGAVQFRVERFGVTANNLTYGVFGDALGYWRFYPAADGWGRIPVWGFGEATASGVEGVRPGDRFYGFWPMSTYVTVQGVADDTGFVASTAERAELPMTYNRYARAVPEAGFAPEHDDAAALMLPLFRTGWLIGSQLAAMAWHGARVVVLTSASSRTAYATAAAIREHDDPPMLVGLTSSANVAFTKRLGLYDSVLTYDEVAALPTDRGVVLVDMAGDPDLRRWVHEVARDVLRASIMVGATHWRTATLAAEDLPGPAPEFFFAPSVGQERAAALGPAAFTQQLADAWSTFADRLPEMIEIRHLSGVEELATAHLAFVDGRANPAMGLIFTL